MRHAPVEGAELHDRDESSQVQHFALHVLAVLHAAQVEQLGACNHPLALDTNSRFGLFLGTETPIMTPNGMNFSYFFFLSTGIGSSATHLTCSTAMKVNGSKANTDLSALL